MTRRAVASAPSLAEGGAWECFRIMSAATPPTQRSSDPVRREASLTPVPSQTHPATPTCLQLPDKHVAIGASHNEEVLQRTPPHTLHRSGMTGGQEDTVSLSDGQDGH